MQRDQEIKDQRDQRNKDLKPEVQQQSSSKTPSPKPENSSGRSLCHKCHKPKYSTIVEPLCPGHDLPGGGGGDESAGESIQESKKSHEPKRKSTEEDVISQLFVNNDHDWQPKDIKGINLAPELNDLPFDSKVISELLTLNALMIHNNNVSRLTIKLLYPFEHLAPEQRREYTNFVSAILDQLQAFKLKHGITETNCLIPDRYDENGKALLSFVIQIPIPGLYNKFIKQLAQNQMLPIQNILQKPDENEKDEKVRYEQGINHFNLTPFSMKLTPQASKRKNEKELEERPGPKRG